MVWPPSVGPLGGGGQPQGPLIPRTRGLDAPTAKRKTGEIITSWVTTLTAVVALTLSVVTYVQVNAEADVHLIMPQHLRISAPDKGYQSIYLQPTFTADRRTERPAVLLNMSLLIESQGKSDDMPLFEWHEVVELTQLETDERPIIRKHVSDPIPLLIYGSEPISPMIWFLPAVPSPTLHVGKLKATLLVDWEGRPSIIRDFCIEIDQNAIEDFATVTDPVLMYRFVKYSTSECYSRI